MNGLSMGSQPTLAPAAVDRYLDNVSLNLSKVIIPTQHILNSMTASVDSEIQKPAVPFANLQAAAHRLGYGVNEADAKKHNLLDGSKPTTLGKFRDASLKANDLERIKNGVGYVSSSLEENRKIDAFDGVRNIGPLPLSNGTSVPVNITFDGKKEVLDIGGDIASGKGLQATLENGVLTLKLGGEMASSGYILSKKDWDPRHQVNENMARSLYKPSEKEASAYVDVVQKRQEHEERLAEPLNQMVLHALDLFRDRVNEIKTTLVASHNGNINTFVGNDSARRFSTADEIVEFNSEMKNFPFKNRDGAGRLPVMAEKNRALILKEYAENGNASFIYRQRGWGVDLGSVKVDGQVVSFTHSKVKN